MSGSRSPSSRHRPPRDLSPLDPLPCRECGSPVALVPRICDLCFEVACRDHLREGRWDLGDGPHLRAICSRCLAVGEGWLRAIAEIRAEADDGVRQVVGLWREASRAGDPGPAGDPPAPGRAAVW